MNEHKRKLFWYKKGTSFIDLDEVIAAYKIITGVKVRLRYGGTVKILSFDNDIERFYSELKDWKGANANEE